MLVNSRTIKGTCPICGAANCTCGGPSNVIPVDERVTRASGKGPLISFPIGRGVSVRLSEEAARRQGLLPAKKQEPVNNKKRLPAGNKGR